MNAIEAKARIARGSAAKPRGAKDPRANARAAAAEDPVLYTRVPSPLGELMLVAAGGALSGIYFAGQQYEPPVEPAWLRADDAPVLRDAARQLAEYFDGRRVAFDLPLAPAGTPFQRAVWSAIGRVPCGRTITYTELARAAGHAGSARAAGAATGRNPLSIVVPCHRIVGASGALTGYAGGLERKRALLALEQAGGAVRGTAA